MNWIVPNRVVLLPDDSGACSIETTEIQLVHTIGNTAQRIPFLISQGEDYSLVYLMPCGFYFKPPQEANFIRLLFRPEPDTTIDLPDPLQARIVIYQLVFCTNIEYGHNLDYA